MSKDKVSIFRTIDSSIGNEVFSLFNIAKRSIYSTIRRTYSPTNTVVTLKTCLEQASSEVNTLTADDVSKEMNKLRSIKDERGDLEFSPHYIDGISCVKRRMKEFITYMNREIARLQSLQREIKKIDDKKIINAINVNDLAMFNNGDNYPITNAEKIEVKNMDDDHISKMYNAYRQCKNDVVRVYRRLFGINSKFANFNMEEVL
jgi:hypothetical protein